MHELTRKNPQVSEGYDETIRDREVVYMSYIRCSGKKLICVWSCSLESRSCDRNRKESPEQVSILQALVVYTSHDFTYVSHDFAYASFRLSRTIPLLLDFLSFLTPKNHY